MDRKLKFEEFAELMDIADEVYWGNIRRYNQRHNEYYYVESARMVSRILKLAKWTFEEYQTELENRFLGSLTK